MTVLLIIICVILLLFLYFIERNLHRDDLVMRKVWRAGFDEKQATLPDGSVLNYGEGGDKNLPALFLIHGQGQAWQDYDAVLPTLSKIYHVFAVDCHGHGKSSHNPARYNCKLMTEDFVWFIKNVIKQPCVISGHSSGGILASNVAATAPEDIKALIIEDAPFFCVEPEEMSSKKAMVWYDGFCLTNEFLSQSEVKSYAEYCLRHGVLWSLFGGLNEKAANSVGKYVKKHPESRIKLWYVPQILLRGMYYGNDFDLKFSMTFYDGSWFDGVSQEEILKGIKCPCTYIKAKTGYLSGGKMVMDSSPAETEGSILCCANTDADAERVDSLVEGSVRVNTPTNDHLIHAKYPELFVNELTKYAK